mgnify:FL=1
MGDTLAFRPKEEMSKEALCEYIVEALDIVSEISSLVPYKGDD